MRKVQNLGLKLYLKAKLTTPDFRPEKSTLNEVIKSIVKSQKWDLVSQIVGDFRKYNLFPDSPVCGNVINGCIKPRKFRILETFIDVDGHENEMGVTVFDVVMRGYNGLHMYSSMIKVYEKMKRAKIGLDSGTYGHIMEAYMKTGDNEKMLELFREFEAMSLVFVVNKAMNCLKICAVLYECLERYGRPFEALQIFREMRVKGGQEDSSVHSSLVSSFASDNEVVVAEELFFEAVEKRLIRDPAIS